MPVFNEGRLFLGAKAVFPLLKTDAAFSGLRHSSVGEVTALVVGKRLRVLPILCEAVHFPRLAEQATGPAILWALAFVMRHSANLKVTRGFLMR